MNNDLVSYYKDRAKEYEKLYLKPERQEDLRLASTLLQEIFIDRNVFEIACGTGYWTEKIAVTAASVFATDINETMLEIARHKNYSKDNVTFGIADIYHFEAPGKFESLFGGFIWSHIALEDLDDFIVRTSQFVAPGSTVVFMDNNFVEGSNLPIAKTDEQGNTFQQRQLENGTTHLVRKNFPTDAFLRNKLEGVATDIEIRRSRFYWILSYRTI